MGAHLTPTDLRTRIDVRIITYVRAFRGTALRGPSLREIMLAVGGTTKSSVSRAVNRLVLTGRLRRLADGLDVPGDVEAAVAMLRANGWQVTHPAA